jgi:hypothetical protein
MRACICPPAGEREAELQRDYRVDLAHQPARGLDREPGRTADYGENTAAQQRGENAERADMFNDVL